VPLLQPGGGLLLTDLPKTSHTSTGAASTEVGNRCTAAGPAPL